MSAAGPAPTPPAALLAALLGNVDAQPGYTATLPGSLVEDISSTDVGALMVVDQARVDASSSVSPYGANAYVLNMFGQQFGVPMGLAANGNALLTFTGNPGYVIPPGFTVSDGTNQYVVQDGGTIGSGGTSQSIFVVASSSGTFAIPANTITTIVTAVPSPYSLTCTNPLAGVSATAPETVQAYRSRILQAYQVAFQGTPTLLKTLLLMLPGVSSRLVSVYQSGSGYEVICGGGDPFQVAGAIYQAVSFIGLLSGSSISSGRNVTVSIYDAPDIYTVTYVNPPAQVVTLAITWNTTLANFTASAAVNQYMISAGQSFVNSITVGQPMNLLVLTEMIQTAVAPVLAVQNLSTLEFAVTINGVPTQPTAGTYLIPSDPESYFSAAATAVTAVQG